VSDLHASTVAGVAGAASAAQAGAAPGASDILLDLTAGLAAGDDLREVLGRFLQPIVQVAGAQAGAVRLVHSHEATMHLIGEVGLSAVVREAERSVEHDCGVCGVARSGDELAWSDESTPCARRHDARFLGGAIRRVLAVPLGHRGRVLGVLNLFFDADREPPNGVPALLRAIGDLLGLALDNSRLEREHLRAAVAGERQAIAADVHDSIGQSLAYVKMRLPLLHDAIDEGDRGAAERYYTDVREAVGQAHASLRAVLTQMRAPRDPLGLAHALAASAAAFRARGTTALEFVDELRDLQLEPDQEEQVFHIVQEALANITRHAAARHAWLHVVGERGVLRVLVQDDGSGLPALSLGEGAHYGLAIMRERARRLGGTLEVGRRAGGGTRVCLQVPCAPHGTQAAVEGRV